MRTLHSYWAYAVVATNLVVGLWGVVRWRRKGTGSRPFWIALGVAWATIYVQGFLGLAIFERYRPPFRHHFYGFLFAIVTLMIFPLRNDEERRRIAAFSFATLFIGIVSVRATLSL